MFARKEGKKDITNANTYHFLKINNMCQPFLRILQSAIKQGISHQLTQQVG